MSEEEERMTSISVTQTTTTTTNPQQTWLTTGAIHQERLRTYRDLLFTFWEAVRSGTGDFMNPLVISSRQASNVREVPET